ncbi:MAG: carboxypeptidase regulatory-like domain-containing protein [Acidobacteria bacterium]|nr:carboxypeptidase regulatory-like domain-containing protein [Acidobacteriota bacterium]
MKLAIRYVLMGTLVLLFSLSTVALAQTGIVKGKVKEMDGKSLEGVLITATNAKNKTEKHETTSDAKGDFEFTRLPAGDYSFSFEKKGYKTFLSRNLTVLGGETLKLKSVIELKRDEAPYSVIRGAVFYGQGFSLPNASVKIERIDGKKFKEEKLSGEGGQFAFRLKAEKAKYRVTAVANGFQPATTEIEIEGDEIRNIALTLQREQ